MSIAVFAAVMSVASASRATVVLDQFSVPETGVISTGVAGGPTLDTTFAVGQMITAGQTGLLKRIDIGVFYSLFGSPSDFDFQLENASGAVVFEQEISAAQVPQFSLFNTTWDQLLSIDLSAANINLYAGDKFSFVVSGRDENDFILEEVNNAPLSYAGGDDFAVINGQKFPFQTPADLAFRTYVNVTPEPAQWALMLLGFGGAGAALRRRRLAAA